MLGLHLWLIACCVALAPALPAHAGTRTVLIWQERLPASADPARLQGLLMKAALPVEMADGRALAVAGRLDPKRVALLILPYGPRYPAPARDALLAYLRGGGSFLSLGGRAFTEPLFPTEAGWLIAGDLRQAVPGEALPVADFEPGGKSPEAATSSDRAGTPQIHPVAEGKGHVLDLHSPALAGYEYVALRPGPGRADRPILRFRARGDRNTRLLCVEGIENDGSRWKAVLPLGSSWATHRLHVAELMAYATPARSGVGDCFHPEALRELKFGYTKAMVGDGPHGFRLDDIAWEPGPALEGAAFGRPLVRQGVLLVESFFGDSMAGRAGDEIPLFRGSSPIREGAVLAAAHPLAPPAPRGAARGWTATGWPDDLATAWAKNPGGRLSLPRQSNGRRATLLEARDKAGRSLGPAFSLIVHARGEFSGGRWAVSALETPALVAAGSAAGDAAFARLARALATSPLLGGLRPEFACEGGKALLRPIADVMNTPEGDAAVQVRFRVLALREGTPIAGDAVTAQVPSGKSAQALGPTVSLDGLDPGAYRLEAALWVAGEEADRAVCTVDLAGALRLLADEFLRRQQADGTYSGVAFSDSRAARTLLAMHAITGERRYRGSALRWGEVTLARQREDGGYRMGYGISSAGEECYVADGGEIALGIARLALDAPAGDRPRYRKSLERYLGFREEFRCPEGGIGVGYCKSDYGARPIVPLKEIRRIYAPEINLYTIGCTLGAASAYSGLFGAPADRERAAADARWLMARTKSGAHGAFVESFVWTHALIADPALRTEIEALLRERLLQGTCGSAQPWWLGGGDRSALDLCGLAYATHTFAPEPAVKAEAARTAYAFCADDSPWSFHRLAAEPRWSHNDWIYASYAGVGAVDLLRPGVSLPGREGQR